jgi:hypothetical protein
MHESDTTHPELDCYLLDSLEILTAFPSFYSIVKGRHVGHSLHQCEPGSGSPPIGNTFEYPLLILMSMYILG